jgi:membrane protein
MAWIMVGAPICAGHDPGPASGRLARVAAHVRAWWLLRDTATGFVADEGMTRGAAIACYTLFSLAPLLFIAIAVAGLAFGEEAARGAVGAQLRALVGQQGAEAVETMVRGAGSGPAGGAGTAIGVVALLVTAAGVFTELRAALNVIWRSAPPAISLSYLLRAWLLSLGLVGATGFLLIVSLLASAALAALGTWAGDNLPAAAAPLLEALNFAASFALLSLLFAAIYKVLPDRRLAWRDVAVGAVATAFLFTTGKSLIGWYIGGSGLAARYGAAGALVVVLLWVYYSAQVFLLGAEFTHAWTAQRGARAQSPDG